MALWTEAWQWDQTCELQVARRKPLRGICRLSWRVLAVVLFWLLFLLSGTLSFCDVIMFHPAPTIPMGPLATALVALFGNRTAIHAPRLPMRVLGVLVDNPSHSHARLI